MTIRKFTEDHEWIDVVDGVGTVGITNHAQEQLGDVVFVELPEVGATIAKGASVGVVESVKAASDIYTPVSGEVVAVNEALVEDPAQVNADPEAGAWFYRIRLSKPDELDGLLAAEAYQALLG